MVNLGLVGVRSKEDTPSDLVAFREWEAALSFDNMPNGVMGFRMGEDAGPEAGVPTEAE
jgi:hypothetical protein